jgi:hypothetical protein
MILNAFIKILVILLLFAGLAAIGQPCLPGGIVFNGPKQISNFPLYNPNCSEISGDLKIYGADSVILSLEGLEQITSVGGDLQIYYCGHITDFSGLHNITHIGGNLEIYYVSQVINLNGFNQL